MPLGEVGCNFYCFSSLGKVFSPLASLKFLLCLWFSATWTWPSSFDIYFAWWSQFPGSVVWCLTLIGGKFLIIIASYISSVSFFLLLLLASLGRYYTFLAVSLLLDVLYQFFQAFFSLLSFWSFYISASIEILSSTHQRHSLFLLQFFFFFSSSIYFYFQNIHLSAYIVCLFLHAVYFFY